jgi:cytochrome c oxidase subunit 1
VLLFIINVVLTLRSGEKAAANPWRAGTLEWATASPPPAYNFDRAPVVRGRDPLWHEEPVPPSEPTHVSGLADKPREVLITTVVDALPDHRLVFPEPTIWPFVSAVAVSALFIGSIFTPWAALWGMLPVAIAVTLWFWPRDPEVLEALQVEKRP